tara:strand:- start:235 stop:447 length:213 start_codon:yes stop_codon:yes gene_type:complete
MGAVSPEQEAAEVVAAMDQTPLEQVAVVVVALVEMMEMLHLHQPIRAVLAVVLEETTAPHLMVVQVAVAL